MKIKLGITFQGQEKTELSLNVDGAGPIVEAMHHRDRLTHPLIFLGT